MDSLHNILAMIEYSAPQLKSLGLSMDTRYDDEDAFHQLLPILGRIRFTGPISCHMLKDSDMDFDTSAFSKMVAGLGGYVLQPQSEVYSDGITDTSAASRSIICRDLPSNKASGRQIIRSSSP